MAYFSMKEPYSLIIKEDDSAKSPREDRDNFGTMICFHSRYNLGDKHDYEEPDDVLRDIVRENISDKDIIDYVKNDKSQSVKLEYNRSEKEWEVNVFYGYYKRWVTETVFSPPIKGQEEIIADTLCQELSITDCMNLINDEVCILPLYLYDHSGITISTAEFSCPWDSGQVGFIYAEKDNLTKQFGDNLNLAEVKNILIAEVKEYDSYLQGECYGFELYKNEELHDSCWGFIGTPKELQTSIEEQLPKECKGIMNHLTYTGSKDNLQDILKELEKKPSILNQLKESKEKLAQAITPKKPILDGDVR